MCGAKYREHTLPLFFKSNQLTIADMYKMNIAAFIYRARHDKLPVLFQNFFVLNSQVHEHFTRKCRNSHIYNMHALINVNRNCEFMDQSCGIQYNTIQYKTFVDGLNFVMETIHKPGKSCEIKQLGMPDRIKMFQLFTKFRNCI